MIYDADMIRWDALLLSQYELIDHQEFQPPTEKFENKDYARFKLCPPFLSQGSDARTQLQEQFLAVADNIMFRLNRCRADNISGMPQPAEEITITHGVTYPPDPLAGNRTVVSIAFEVVEAMMSPNLTPTEQALENFRFAVIILHESVVYHPFF